MPTAFANQMFKRAKLGRLVIESGSTVVLEPEVMVQVVCGSDSSKASDRSAEETKMASEAEVYTI